MTHINRYHIKEYLILSLFNLNKALENIDYSIKKHNHSKGVILKLKKLYDFLKAFENESEKNRSESVIGCEEEKNESYFRTFITGSGPICNGEYWGTYYSWCYNKKKLTPLLKKYNEFLQDDMFIGFCNNITKETIKEKEKKII